MVAPLLEINLSNSSWYRETTQEHKRWKSTSSEKATLLTAGMYVDQNFKIDLQLQKLILHMLQYAFQADYNSFLTIWHFRLWSVTDYMFAFFSDWFQCGRLCLRRLRAPCHCLVLGLNDQQAWGGCWLVSQVLHVPCVLNHESYNQMYDGIINMYFPKSWRMFSISVSERKRRRSLTAPSLSANLRDCPPRLFPVSWRHLFNGEDGWCGIGKDHNQNKRRLASEIFLERPRQYYSQFLCYV